MKYVIKVTEPNYRPEIVTVVANVTDVIFTAELTDEQLRKLGYDSRIESVEEIRRASNFNLR
jgi:hypothetical protein